MGVLGGNIKKFEEAWRMSPEDKEKLYEIIDYQENAHHGVFPKRFVAHKMRFQLDVLNVTVRDEDWNDMTVLRLELQAVENVFSQRPSAGYMCLETSMEKLTVTGLAHKFKKRGSAAEAPVMVETKMDAGSRLLHFSFENNPPESYVESDLDEDKGSIYDQRIRFIDWKTCDQ